MEEYFGFTRTPFGRDLPPQSLYRSAQFSELLARLRYAATTRALAVVTGEIGSGKSTAVRALSASLDSTRHPFVYISDSGLDGHEFYREVLSQFGVTPAHRRGDVRRQFSHLMLDLYQNQGKAPVIAIDEAHLLAQAMLQEIRYLTNFAMDSLCPFSLVLIGQPELRATLRLKAFEAVRQRVTIRFHLGGLDELETKAYIEHGVRMAGATRTIFTDAAIRLIHTHSRGLPRVINNLCTASLLDVYAHEGNLVEPDNAQRAINDLADQ